jgi:hypothetical protein
MWCGIAVFVFVGLGTANSNTRWDWYNYLPLLIVYWPVITIVTGGLIYTFRDKKDKTDKK